VAYRVRFKLSAAEAIRKLPKAHQRRVIAKAEALADTPRPPECKKLHGSDDFYRIRVGDYRIVYAVEDQDLVILVVRVGHRKEVYRIGS
jgi:mRNA interferase RelE/StbE